MMWVLHLTKSNLKLLIENYFNFIFYLKILEYKLCCYYLSLLNWIRHFNCFWIDHRFQENDLDVLHGEAIIEDIITVVTVLNCHVQSCIQKRQQLHHASIQLPLEHLIAWPLVSFRFCFLLVCAHCLMRLRPNSSYVGRNSFLLLHFTLALVVLLHH